MNNDINKRNENLEQEHINERVHNTAESHNVHSGTEHHATTPDINDDRNKVESVRDMVEDRLETSKTGTPTHNDVTFKKDHGRTTSPLGASHEPGTIPGSSL